MIDVTPSSLALACPDPAMRVLVANRGEIARRVIRTMTDWGVETVAIYADPDEHALHVAEATTSVRVGPAQLAESYLSIDAILEAAKSTGATHVHPGYGFLSERTEFAEAVAAAGLTWIGPSAEAVASMGSKIEARSVAIDAGVPVIPGFNESQDDDALRSAATEIGYPILVKASAGGGGKGIRIANAPDEFDTALNDARSEALRAFGDDAVIVERYITRPRHVEVQVAADTHGTAIELGTRECSVQRRYQKLLEEAPAPNLPDDVRQAIRESAVRLCERIGYDSVGTVEYIVDANSNEFFFLEMNTRIQVEHTVTEQVTGIDLIALQTHLACGEAMPYAADVFDTSLQGTAIEVRINAEDSWNGFIPQTGQIETLTVPADDHLRWDAAIESGSVISPHYDSMVGKLIAHGTNRIEALDRLADALEGLTLLGPTTNVGFHRWLLAQPEVRSATVTTRFLDEVPLPRAEPFGEMPPTSPWGTRTGRRLTPHRSTFAFDSESRDDRWHGAGASGDAGRELAAPFPGLITELHVSPGDLVEAGQTLATIEAMKMLHPLVAAGPTTIDEVLVEVGSQVESGDTLITFVPSELSTEST